MEQKKIREIQRSTHEDNDRSQSRDHIPLDLIVEILSRLPAKSIVRSRSISRLWSSITTTPDFINSFAVSSKPCGLLLYRKHDKLFVASSPLHQNTYPQVENTYSYNGYPLDFSHQNTYPQAESYQFTLTPNNGYLERYNSVHGLICLQTSTQLMIWNPTMKRFLTLPQPKGSEGKYKAGLLGYDPIGCKYKVLCLLRGDKIGILTVGAQESWRILSKGFPRPMVSTGCVLCINGVIYYEGYFEVPMKHAIMSFDVRSEKFSLIKYPMGNSRRFVFVSYEGRLALVVSSIEGSGVELWLLEDAKNHHWIRKHFLSPDLPYTRWCMKEWTLKGITNAGEFIYIYTPKSTNRPPSEITPTKWSLYEWFHILYFDPNKNSFRQVNFRGIASGDFKRFGEDGYNLNFMRDLSVIPNHIESLMSL